LVILKSRGIAILIVANRIPRKPPLSSPDAVSPAR
jgi:hypothetical protein